MLDVDVDQLQAICDNLQKTLKDGLLATDIWEKTTGLSLAGINAQPAAVALFNLLSDEISATLADSGFAELGQYYILDLEGDHAVIVIKHNEEMVQGVLYNSAAVNLGVLFGIAVPKAIKSAQEALAPAAAA